MTMPHRDEFDDPEGFFGRLVTHTGSAAGSIFDHKSLIISGAVFVAVVALSGVIWASYPSQNPLGNGAVPIIRADAEPYKYVPADRGGMDIPHQDSTIFGAMRANAPTSKVENLLDDGTEQPVDRSQLFAGLKADVSEAAQQAADEVEVASAGSVELRAPRPMTESERRAEAARRNRELLNQEATPLPGEVEGNNRRLPDVLETTETKPVLDNTEAAEDVDNANVAPTLEPAPVKAAAKPQPKHTKAPAPVAAPAPAVAKIPAPTPATAAGSTSYVQVASVPTEGAIKGEWATVSGKLPMIAGMNYRVQKADLGAKGTYHRIQVGPMSKEAAVDLCGKIKAQKPGGCLVVK